MALFKYDRYDRDSVTQVKALLYAIAYVQNDLAGKEEQSGSMIDDMVDMCDLVRSLIPPDIAARKADDVRRETGITLTICPEEVGAKLSIREQRKRSRYVAAYNAELQEVADFLARFGGNHA